MAVRDENGFVLCCHGRPMTCIECGNEYAEELDGPAGEHSEPDDAAAVKPLAETETRSAESTGPLGSFGYCATCYHPLDQCSHCDPLPLAEALTACQQERKNLSLNCEIARQELMSLMAAVCTDDPVPDATVVCELARAHRQDSEIVDREVEKREQAEAALTACRAQGEAMRRVPAEFVDGNERHNAQRAWLAGFDAALSSTPKEPA